MTDGIQSCLSSDTSHRVVVLEPEEPLARTIAMAIWGETGMAPCVAATVTEAVTSLHDHPKSTFAAVVGFDNPGASALLDKLTEKDIPVVVYGLDYTKDARKQLSTLTIADVVVSERDGLAKAVGASMGRLASNRDVTILVVDDSRSMRMALSRFLKTRCFRVLEARDGVEGLAVLAAHPEVKLVITDNEMPNMDGFSFIREVRKRCSKDDLAIIGISARTNSQLSVKFITHGANDFLQKPFVKEELYCRVDHNVDMLRRIELIRDLSNRDPLTRLSNRRYFFDHCDEFLELATAASRRVVAAMIDIDHFKRFNDEYGHGVGDTVLRQVAEHIANAFPDNAIVSRFGGEEFCVLAAHAQDDDIFARYDKLRRAIESDPVVVDDACVVVTVSMGICAEADSVQHMLTKADGRLYRAKEAGRNRVVLA